MPGRDGVANLKRWLSSDRASDIVRWCGFAQLTSCRIRLHNQRKNHIIACGEKGLDIKFSGKKTAAFSNLVQVTHDIHLM